MRRLQCGVLVAWLAPAAAWAQPAELLDRTLAIVGTQVITLGDARAAIRLGLVEAAPSADPASVTQLLVDRELVLREVQRYAPPAPSDSTVEARLDELRKRLPAPGEWAQILEATGFTEARLRAWVRDDLRTVAYLAQRFASASTPADAEVAGLFTQERATFERAGTTFEQAAPGLRERLVEARRRELITDWVSDLRRRTTVVLLPQ
ncbi:MAG: hypothetical protein Q8O42_05440 [Acidobacteriota bacterium]|nr:hypothetical protein [Acidobacteriota bacterium]